MPEIKICPSFGLRLRRLAFHRMSISDQRLDDFIEIYEKVFEVRLSREEARPIATRLVTIYRLITQPLPPDAIGRKP